MLEHQGDGLAVISDVEPVAHVESVSVDGERLAVERVEDDQRNQFFRKLKGAVIVGAVGGERGQSVGVLVGAHQVIAAGLGGRVGTVGLIGMGFGKGRIGGAERSVDFVGGDVEEAEAGLGLRGQGAVVGQRLMQQAEGSDDVGEDELFGAGDGAVDVALGGKVYQGIGLVGPQQRLDEGGVFDAALHEDVSGVILDRGKIAEIAGVGELVEVDDAVAGGDALQIRSWSR